MTDVAPSPFPSWAASLQLAYDHRDGRTTPARRLSSGPLRLQKSFWPEGPETCHQIVVHPPGGIAGNDQLSIDLQLQANSQVLLTTPGAAKWYASLGPMASQTLCAELGTNSRLEWLPQESIFFTGSKAQLVNDWILAPDSQLITAEILCFGRPANQEPFSEGLVRQHNRYWLRAAHTDDIARADCNRRTVFAAAAEHPQDSVCRPNWAHRLLFQERFQLLGNSAALQAQAALGAHPCVGTLVATVPPLAEKGWLEHLRSHLPDCTPESEWAVTCLPPLLILRWRGQWAEAGWSVMRQAWQSWRQELSGKPAPAVRIWAT